MSYNLQDNEMWNYIPETSPEYLAGVEKVKQEKIYIAVGIAGVFAWWLTKRYIYFKYNI